MIKLAILSLSLLTVMSGAAVAPALANIIAAFPGSSAILGKMVLTTPALTIIPVSLLTGVFSSHVSRKKLIYAGIVLYIIGGFGGGFGGGLANSIPFFFWFQLAFRTKCAWLNPWFHSRGHPLKM